MKKFLLAPLLLVFAMAFSRKEDCQIQNCQTCSDSGVCIMCDIGHTLEINRETETIQCSQDENLVLIDFGLTAITCIGNAANNCNTCFTPNFCNSCSSGYMPNAAGICVPTNCNVQNCQLCASISTCQVCENGYILKANACLQCTITGCMSCSADEICQACYPEYTLQNGTCEFVGCMYPCSSCSNGICTGCLAPFAPVPWDNGTCFTCSVPNCNNCGSSNYSQCLGCIAGYILTGSSCTPVCSSNLCETCINTTVCQKCIAGYTVAGAGTCSECNNSPICIACTVNNTANCTACTTGYYLNSSNQCQPCPPGCTKCGPVGSGNNTLICSIFTGFPAYTSTTVTNYIYKMPYVCDPGCAQCASNYPASCILCSPGYYAVNSTSSNYVVQCIPCYNSNCMTCQIASNNSVTCLSCYSNAFLVNGTCHTCNSTMNCLTCNMVNISNCSSCPIGYLMTWAGDLQTCTTPCPQYCLTCFNSTNTAQGTLKGNNISCSSCVSGFGLTVTGLCLPCPANCRVCSGQYQQICIQCGAGYYMEGGVCYACTSGCSSCNQFGCLICASGFNLIAYSGKVLCSMGCTLPCASCQYNQPTNCTSCILGYNLNGSNCYLPTNSSCSITPTTPNGCEYCGFGQVLSDGNCINCTVGNCTRCNPANTGQCNVCNYGFYVNITYLCTPCPTGCATCNGPQVCLSCQYNYTSQSIGVASYSTGNQVICVACAAPCLQCTQSPQFCTSCIDGFTFTGWNCLSNFYYQFTINLDVNQQEFYNNYQAFINQFSYAMQTASMRVININNLGYNPNGDGMTAQVSISSAQQNNTWNSALQYNNLYFALVNTYGWFANMPVLNASLQLPIGETVPNTINNTPLICCIVIPISILIVVGFGYFIFSKNNMDLPGSNYIPAEPATVVKEIGDTEMKTL